MSNGFHANMPNDAMSLMTSYNAAILENDAKCLGISHNAAILNNLCRVTNSPILLSVWFKINKLSLNVKKLIILYLVGKY